MLECLILSLTVTSLLVQQQLSFEDTRAKNVDLIRLSAGGGRGSFTPLVFFSSGGMGKAATVTYQRLASLSNKWNSSYSVMMAGVGSAVLLASPCFALR